VDFQSKTWACPFCYMRNHFPPHYSALSETNLSAELIPSFSTIEYLLPRSASMPPVFLFVVDTCLPEDQMQPLKDALLVALGLLPSNAIVGLITFGSTVQVHELSFDLCPKSYVFNGAKEIDPKQVQQLLGFGGPAAQMQARNPREAAAASRVAGGDKRFVVNQYSNQHVPQTIFCRLARVLSSLSLSLCVCFLSIYWCTDSCWSLASVILRSKQSLANCKPIHAQPKSKLVLCVVLVLHCQLLLDYWVYGSSCEPAASICPPNQ
jgi:hypothetical protein